MITMDTTPYGIKRMKIRNLICVLVLAIVGNLMAGQVNWSVEVDSIRVHVNK